MKEQRRPKPREYRMNRRRELVDLTRQRITEAAMRLHTTAGPAQASISAIADEAGVTRLTLYRHFASKDDLFQACMTHWAGLHPPPSPEAWRAIPTFENRLRVGLRELYEWFGANGEELYPVYRDVVHAPESTRHARQAANDEMTGALLTDFRFSAAARRRLRALVGHVIGFWTWRSLVVEQGLSIREASGLAADVVLAVATDA
jgi:AcrR family transcriptional regulator